MTQVTVNGNKYSDDGSTPRDMNNGGFRQQLLPMISDTMIDTSGKVAAAAHQAELAQAAADAAAVSASTAVSGPGSNATSTTSLTVAMGIQSLAIQPGKTLSPGMPCTIASTASPRNWMNGSIDSYNSATGALQVYVTNIGVVTPGVYPTLSAWLISLSGPAAVSGVLNEMKGADKASAATINLDDATGNYLHITGSAVPIVTITLAQGAEREAVIDGTPIFVHSANLDLPTRANIQAQAGDIVRFRGEGGGVVKVTSWTRATGRPLVTSGFVEMTASGTFPPAPGASYYFVDLVAGGASGGASINNYAPGAGGGERIQRLIPALMVTAPVTVLVGSGGQPVTVTTGQALGNNGSDTSFGNFVTAHGGRAAPSQLQGGSGGGVVQATQATGQVGAIGGSTPVSAEWGGGSGGGMFNGADSGAYEGGSSVYGAAGSGAVSSSTSVPSGKAGGRSGTYTSGGGGLAGTSTSRNGGPGKDATSPATCGDGGGASHYAGANNVGGDGGFPGGAGGGAVSSSGSATSGAGRGGIARIYWW